MWRHVAARHVEEHGELLGGHDVVRPPRDAYLIPHEVEDELAHGRVGDREVLDRSKLPISSPPAVYHICERGERGDLARDVVDRVVQLGRLHVQCGLRDAQAKEGGVPRLFGEFGAQTVEMARMTVRILREDGSDELGGG